MKLELEAQVCNLKLSKKLKELGVKQESNWYWYDIVGKSEKEQEDSAHLGDADYVLEFKTFRPYFATFTVAQLGEMLPDGMQSNRIDYPDKKIWHSWAWNFKPSFFAKTEANARAKMLIYLLENNFIKEVSNESSRDFS